MKGHSNHITNTTTLGRDADQSEREEKTAEDQCFSVAKKECDMKGRLITDYTTPPYSSSNPTCQHIHGYRNTRVNRQRQSRKKKGVRLVEEGEV